MLAQRALILLALALPSATAAFAATQATPLRPAAIVNAQAFRCLDTSGQPQYQQQPCSNEAGARQISVKDERTDEQRSQARRMAVREQDLARHVSYVRRQEDRHAMDANARAKRLTVQPRRATPTIATTQGVTVVPRKRDFRAVSAKTERHAKKLKAKTPASLPHQTG